MSDRRAPFTVIGGYLGAGKTTLLNHLLRESGGRRLAVLVNDFGDINIDAELIASDDHETVNLANGCVCCSLSDGLAVVLGRLRQRADSIDHVVIEASGVADPVKIGQYGQPFGFELRGVIVLADTEQVRERATNKYVGDTVVAQLRGADLLVLNKVDLVDPDMLADVRAWVEVVAPGARMVEAAHGVVPMPILLGGDGPSDVSPSEPRLDGPTALERHEHDHAHEYESWVFVTGDPIGRDALEAFLDALPSGVLRAKGFAHLADDPGQRYLVQVVGRRSTVKGLGPWADASAQTRLVAIGLPGSLDPDRLSDLLLTSCLRRRPG